jgi:hypothetical protein
MPADPVEAGRKGGRSRSAKKLVEGLRCDEMIAATAADPQVPVNAYDATAVGSALARAGKLNFDDVEPK